MQFDNLLNLSTAQTIQVTAASTSTYDITGAGIGNAPNMIGGVVNGVNAVIGADLGAGDGMTIPEIVVNIPTAFTTGNAATLTIQLQASADNGSNQAAGWQTIYQSAALTPGIQLAANNILQFQMPPVPPGFGEAEPRFYRLNYVVGTGSMSAGALSANIVINPSQATKIQNYPSNYSA